MKEITSHEVESAVRKYLKGKHYKISPSRKHGETGADIVATKGQTKLFIEVIGYNTKPPIKSREFYESFFRIISRDENDKEHKLIIALPIKFLNGMKQRKL
ncbi:MAG: hypothetical protein Q7K21_02455, partial [Elusimicrobiota bacterium]|nr:hypothetical protein [Elusimicrobiota bacterium]